MLLLDLCHPGLTSFSKYSLGSLRKETVHPVLRTLRFKWPLPNQVASNKLHYFQPGWCLSFPTCKVSLEVAPPS